MVVRQILPQRLQAAGHRFSTTIYFQDIVSSIYLRGQADHSFFDLSAYHFEGTTDNDDNRTLPPAVPVFDFNRVLPVPERPNLRTRRRIDR